MRTRSFTLQAHSTTPALWVESLSVTIERSSERELRFIYVLRGDVQQIEIPSSAAPERTDDLWRHTCFEAFLRTRGAPAYYEFNFSPSSQWAAYSFEAYRSGMTPLPLQQTPSIRCDHDSLQLTLTASIAIPETLAQPWELGLSAVVRNRNGAISYLALRHGPGKPDFHHEDSFCAVLDGAGSG